MKSNNDQLKNRGYLSQEFENTHSHISFNEKLKLLKSGVAINRTLGARLLHKESRAVTDLIQALKTEKKLYPKIEICNTLVSIGEQAVIPLISELGKIGKNQYTSIPEKEFEKNNYPLPRDIVARTLAFMGKPALPGLLMAIETLSLKQLNEAIDAVGYICFYHNCSGVFNNLVNCWTKNIQNDLICWKIIRAMSAFAESKPFLLEQRKTSLNIRIGKEIERSLRIVEKNRT